MNLAAWFCKMGRKKMEELLRILQAILVRTAVVLSLAYSHVLSKDSSFHSFTMVPFLLAGIHLKHCFSSWCCRNQNDVIFSSQDIQVTECHTPSTASFPHLFFSKKWIDFMNPLDTMYVRLKMCYYKTSWCNDSELKSKPQFWVTRFRMRCIYSNVYVCCSHVCSYLLLDICYAF